MTKFQLPTRINRKRFFITKSRKYETTKKIMKTFVFFRFRVFVIAFIFLIF